MKRLNEEEEYMFYYLLPIILPAFFVFYCIVMFLFKYIYFLFKILNYTRIYNSSSSYKNKTKNLFLNYIILIIK